jgi:hypothetical protein
MYRVIEDNSGGLSLFVFDENGKVIFGRDACEQKPGALWADLSALDAGISSTEGQGGIEDPQQQWDFWQKQPNEWREIVRGGGGNRILLPGYMGTIAKEELRVQ